LTAGNLGDVILAGNDQMISGSSGRNMKTQRSSLTAVAGALAAATLSVSAHASQPPADDRSQVVAVVQHIMEAFNKGDTATLKSLFEDDVSIVDDMPPFVWRGHGAIDAWLGDADKDTQLNKDTEAVSILGPPAFLRVEGDRAYASFPDHFGYKRGGRQIREAGAVTFVLRRTDAGWRAISVAYVADRH
jgi:uncharacterized protein (TIGR02246 family)